MKKEQLQQATRLAEQLIDTNLSEFGRAESVKTAAYLQYAEGHMRDYINELEETITGLDVPTLLPPLISNWDTLSSTQKRQSITEVARQLRSTLNWAKEFHQLLTKQTSFIEEVNAQAVEQETTRIAQENKEST
ncbi:hypothetical protein [Fibrella aquatica]|uniref:hypothetical protein n=1 Tax=Fibrella aquatica TaxID=3242487 RepID=UPI003520F9D4